MYVKESGVWLTKKPTMRDKLLLKRLNAAEDEIDQQRWVLWPIIGLCWLAAIIGPIVGAVALDRVSTFLQCILVIFVILVIVAGIVILVTRLMDGDDVVTPVVEWLFFRGKREDKDYIDVDTAPAFASLARVAGAEGCSGDWRGRGYLSPQQSWCEKNIAFASEVNAFLADPVVPEVTRQLSEAPLNPNEKERSVIAALNTRLDVRAKPVIEEIDERKTKFAARRAATREEWVANARAVADVTETSDNAANNFTKKAS